MPRSRPFSLLLRAAASAKGDEALLQHRAVVGMGAPRVGGLKPDGVDDLPLPAPVWPRPTRG